MTPNPSQNSIGYLLSRMQAPTQQQGRIPNTDSAAQLSREDRKDAISIARYYTEQREKAMAVRRTHAIEWTKVLSISSGIHYFKIDAYGSWTPLMKSDPRDIRAKVPLMEPLCLWEHARLSSNQIRYEVVPTTGRGADQFHAADLAQNTLNHWGTEIQIEDVDDEASNDLVYFGGTCLFIDKQPWAQQCYLRHFPMCDIWPIPFDAKSWAEASGIGMSTLVSDDWLRQQDDIWERSTGQKPTRPFARAARSISTSLGGSYQGFSRGFGWLSTAPGAIATWIWRRKNEANPFGEHVFLLDDELHGYVSGSGPNGSLALVNEEIPLRPIFYTKKPHEFWPRGFAESLVSMQLEANRQMSAKLKSANVNRGLLLFDSARISLDDIQDCPDGLVPFKNGGSFEDKGPLAQYIAPVVGTQEGRGIMAEVQQMAREAAGYQSDVIFGGSEGRVDGGPAVGMLNTNSQTRIKVVLDRKERAYEKIGGDAIDAIRTVWPQSKRIRVMGPVNLGREIMVDRSRLPGASDLIIRVGAMVPNGRMGMLSMMTGLRNMPDEEGGGPILKAHEFRRSMALLGLAPPGIQLFNKVEQRIMYRIGQLINDGVSPAINPAGAPGDMQDMEDHTMAVNILKEVILDPSFMMFSPQVRKALQTEIQFHNGRIGGITKSVDRFDDAVDRMDQQQMEDFLDYAEQDPMSQAGVMATM